MTLLSFLGFILAVSSDVEAFFLDLSSSRPLLGVLLQCLACVGILSQLPNILGNEALLVVLLFNLELVVPFVEPDFLAHVQV